MFQGPNIALSFMLYTYAQNHDAHMMFSKTLQCNTKGVTTSSRILASAVSSIVMELVVNTIEPRRALPGSHSMEIQFTNNTSGTE